MYHFNEMQRKYPYLTALGYTVSVPFGYSVAISPEVKIKRSLLADVDKNFNDLSLESLKYFCKINSASSHRELSDVFQLSDAKDDDEFADMMESALSSFQETGCIELSALNFKSILYFAFASCETKNSAVWDCSRMLQKMETLMENRLSKLEADALAAENEMKVKAEQEQLALKAESERLAILASASAKQADENALSQASMEESLRVAFDRIAALESRLELDKKVVASESSSEPQIAASTKGYTSSYVPFALNEFISQLEHNDQASVDVASSSTGDTAPKPNEAVSLENRSQVTPSVHGPFSGLGPFAEYFDKNFCIRDVAYCCHHAVPCPTLLSPEEEVCRSFDSARRTYLVGVRSIWLAFESSVKSDITSLLYHQTCCVQIAHDALKNQFSSSIQHVDGEALVSKMSAEVASLTAKMDEMFASIGIDLE